MTIGEHNLARLAEQSLDRLGDRDSVHFEGEWLRSAALFDRATRLAAGFAELGVGAGDRVVVMMANCPEVGICYSALWRAGAVITPAVFLLPPAELRHLLVDSGAVAIVTTPELLLTVELAADAVDTLRWIICAETDEAGIVNLESLEDAAPGEIVPRADDDLAALLYTGGTTGRAKGVMLSHENLWSCARSSYEASDVPGITRTIVPLPLSHAFGLSVSVTGMHQQEPGDSVLMRWFDPQGFVDLVEAHAVQRATLVPSMLQMLLQVPLEDHDLSSLRIVNVGAAPLAPDLVAEFEQRVPSAEILEGYGCTESGGVIAVNRPGARRLGTVGQPLPGYEVKVVPLEDTDGDGPLGEICCRSSGVMQGYWNGADATATALRDGWFHTGDIGQVDEDGYVSVVDRKKDLIIRGGFNVYPRDVEDALMEHPSVAMAGVVGRPHDRHGEEVVAFVAVHGEDTVTSEELIAFARRRVGGYKYPREIRVRADLPLTPVGKLDRKALRSML
jgi:long-chain acyl-CoA synthetase